MNIKTPYKFQLLANKINQLPPNEINYYLLLLLTELQKEPSDTNQENMLNQIDAFVTKLQVFYVEKTPESLEKTALALEHLLRVSKTHTWTRAIQNIFLHICRVFTSLICGMLGALTGTSAGLFSQWNFLKGGYTGFLIGCAIGLKIGKNLPEKALLNTAVLKITYSLDHMRRITSELNDKYLKDTPQKNTNPYAEKQYDVYQNETKKYIIETFFDKEVDKEKAFKNFLKSTQSFQVCAAPAIFTDRKLDGTLGNHSLIRYRINGKIGSPIEYGGRRATPRWVNQAEPSRHVSGQKLFDMLTFDRVLQKTHGKTFKFRLFGFEMGNNDCHTYVNKVLTATGQKPAAVKRFIRKTDTKTGYHLVRPCIETIQIYKEKDIEAISSFHSGKPASLHLFKKPASKQTTQSIDGWLCEEGCIQKPFS